MQRSVVGVGLSLALVLGAGAAVAAARLPAHPPAAPAPLAQSGSVAPQADVLASPLSLPHAASRLVAPLPAAAARAAGVARLGTLRTPDLLVRVPAGATPAQLRALQGVAGVTATTVVELGAVVLGGTRQQLAGVDPSQFRSFTPRSTASSDALWQSVARGDLSVSYGVYRTGHLALGGGVLVAAVRERVGSVAAFGLPGTDLVLNHAGARALGLRPASGVLVAAPSRGVESLAADVARAVPGATTSVLRPQPVLRVPVGRPRTYRDLYVQSAAACPGLRWQVLAAIGQIESGHGRNTGPSTAGALGPMQFLPETWAVYGVDGDGDGRADIMNPYDAVPAAALYLCRNGAGQGAQGLYDAVFAYNHADWYVQEVLALADQYR